MSVDTPVIPSVVALVEGDPRRAAVGRAAAGALVSAIVFVAFAWASKEIRVLSEHAPWQNDPYDAVVSFTIFFVPLGAGILVIRTLVCRPEEPLPVTRLVGMLRAARIVVAAVLVTIAADWLSVLQGADRATWNGTTGALVVGLAITTLVGVPAAMVVHRAHGIVSRESGSPAGPDFLADALTLGRQATARLGPLGRPSSAILRGLEVHAAPTARRHPLTAAALGGVAFGAGLSAAEARAEGVGPVLGLLFGVATCGMFAFLAAAGAYLGIARAERPLVGAGRRLADATVLAAAAVPITVGFRGSMWWVVGATNARAGLVELVGLLLVVAAATFFAVLGAETLAGIHGRRVHIDASAH